MSGDQGTVLYNAILSATLSNKVRWTPILFENEHGSEERKTNALSTKYECELKDGMRFQIKDVNNPSLIFSSSIGSSEECPVSQEQLQFLINAANEEYFTWQSGRFDRVIDFLKSL